MCVRDNGCHLGDAIFYKKQYQCIFLFKCHNVTFMYVQIKIFYVKKCFFFKPIRFPWTTLYMKTNGESVDNPSAVHNADPGNRRSPDS